MARSDPPDWRELPVSDAEVIMLETLASRTGLVGGQANRDARHPILQDPDRVARIVRLGTVGKELPDLLDELAESGLGVMVAWMRSGKIFIRVSKIGRPVQREGRVLDLTLEACNTVANSTVASAIPFFIKKAIIAGQWHPELGASLKTYFIGACVLKFTNEFNRWANEQRSWDAHHSLASDPDDVAYFSGRSTGSFDPTAEEVVETEAERARLRSIEDPKTRIVAYRIGRGDSFSEAGNAVGISGGAAGNRIRRLRQKPQFSNQPWNSGH